MRFNKYALLFIGLTTAGMATVSLDYVNAHGDVTPQAIDTSELPDIGEEWLEENPWRDPTTKEWATAIQIGASGYNQNCARCHGLEVISGGLAPDLRYLEANIDGDEWYLERYQVGYTALDDHVGRLKEIRKQIAGYVAAGKSINDVATEITPLVDEMDKIAKTIETGSEAPIADSAASRAVTYLTGDNADLSKAVETLTVGLSAAQ